MSKRCPICNGEKVVAKASDDPQKPNQIVPCPCVTGGKEFSPIGDALGAALKRLDVMEAEWKGRRAAMESARREAPVRPCPAGGPAHRLDVERTLQASGLSGPWQWRYAGCQACGNAIVPEWMERSGIPRRLLLATFDNWKPRTVRDMANLRACREFAQTEGGALVMTGGVGLGKTHLAVAVMRQLRHGIMITQNGLLTKLREGYRKDNAVDIVAKCKAAKLLVLDELGVSSGGRDEAPALYEVINHRHGNDLKTIFTTNLPANEFAAAFGERIADRLSDYEPFLEFKGASWRGRQSQTPVPVAAQRGAGSHNP